MGWNVENTLPRGLNGHPIVRIAKPQPWKAKAACIDVNPDLFYPEGRGAEGREQVARARAVCAGCTVRLECLAFALATNEEYGIWGGTTERQRRTIRAWLRRLQPGPHRRRVA